MTRLYEPFSVYKLIYAIKINKLVLGGFLNINTEKYDYFIGKFFFFFKNMAM